MATKMTREEALNKVRQMSLPKETMEILEALAPELAESEDERIRKAIIRIIKNSNVFDINVSHERMFAYLEKQAEQKQEKFPPYVTGFKGDPDPAGTSDLEEAAARYERENRQSILSSVDIVDAFIAGAEWQKEQKPAEWSEEDEKDMAHIIRILNDCYVYAKHDLSKTDHENLVNKLKSLRPQYHGDVTMTEAYKMGLEAGKASHWKPSEEQMKALNEIVNILAASPFLHQNDYLFNILNGLREELKKLL